MKLKHNASRKTRRPGLPQSVGLFVVVTLLAPSLVARDVASADGSQTPFHPLNIAHVGDGQTHDLTASQDSVDREGADKSYRFYYNSELPADQMTVKPGERMRIWLVPETSGTFVLMMEGDLGLRMKKEESEGSKPKRERPAHKGSPEPGSEPNPEEAERIAFQRPL